MLASEGWHEYRIHPHIRANVANLGQITPRQRIWDLAMADEGFVILQEARNKRQVHVERPPDTLKTLGCGRGRQSGQVAGQQRAMGLDARSVQTRVWLWHR